MKAAVVSKANVNGDKYRSQFRQYDIMWCDKAEIRLENDCFLRHNNISPLNLERWQKIYSHIFGLAYVFTSRSYVITYIIVVVCNAVLSTLIKNYDKYTACQNFIQINSVEGTEEHV